MKKLRNSFLLLITAAIWGAAFVSQSSAMDYVGPFTFLSARNILGGTVLIPLILIFYRNESKDKILYSVKAGLICGFFLFSASICQQIAMIDAPAGKGGFITAMYIVLVPIIGLFFKKKCSPFLWLGVLFAVAGLFMVSIGTSGEFKIMVSDIWLIVCALLFSFQILSVDHFGEKSIGIIVAATQFYVSAILSAIGMFTVDGPFFGISPSFECITAAAIPILYAGILSSGVAYTLQIIAQKDLNPTVASIIMSLESVFAAIAGAVILKEQLTKDEIIGCVLMFIAIILAQLPSNIIKTKKSD